MMLLSDQYVTICASKYFSVEEMRILHQKGVRHFGENRVQDMIKKMHDLKDLDIVWHFIGHLQSNKVKDIIDRVDYLHTLDRMSLVEAIDKHATKPILSFVQVNLTREPQKSGVLVENLNQFLLEIKKYVKIKIIGLMTIGMADDPKETERVFKVLEELGKTYDLPYLSMGMSDDYELALKHHATHLRIGRMFKSMIG